MSVLKLMLRVVLRYKHALVSADWGSVYLSDASSCAVSSAVLLSMWPLFGHCCLITRDVLQDGAQPLRCCEVMSLGRVPEGYRLG